MAEFLNVSPIPVHNLADQDRQFPEAVPPDMNIITFTSSTPNLSQTWREKWARHPIKGKEWVDQISFFDDILNKQGVGLGSEDQTEATECVAEMPAEFQIGTKDTVLPVAGNGVEIHEFSSPVSGLSLHLVCGPGDEFMLFGSAGASECTISPDVELLECLAIGTSLLAARA